MIGRSRHQQAAAGQAIRSSALDALHSFAKLRNGKPLLLSLTRPGAEFDVLESDFEKVTLKELPQVFLRFFMHVFKIKSIKKK